MSLADISIIKRDIENKFAAVPVTLEMIALFFILNATPCIFSLIAMSHLLVSSRKLRPVQRHLAKISNE